MLLLATIFTIFFSSTSFSQTDSTAPIRAYMDMQMHPTMHVPYSFFGDGFEFFDDNAPPHLTHLHQFKKC